MALRTFVKTGSITNLSDARYCAGMGVEILGFCLDATSADFVSPQQFQSIAGWIAGVQFAGEVLDADQVDLKALLPHYSVQWLQIENASDWEELARLEIPLICKVPWQAESTAHWFNERYSAVAPFVSLFLLESDLTELTESMRYEIGNVAKQYEILLGFGLESYSILSLLEQMPLKGVALRGSHEIRPGYKEFGELADILETLEAE